MPRIALAPSPVRLALRSAPVLLVTLLFPNGPVQAACIAEDPAGVLACYESAYADRDAQAFEEMLAEDFVFAGITLAGPTELSRDDVVGSTRKMLTSPKVESLVLSFDPTYDVVPGTESNSWKIENLVAHLTVRVSEPGESTPKEYAVTSATAIYVRLVASPSPHCQIFREEQFYDE